MYPSSKRTGYTILLRWANFQMQEIWHDFCFRSFIWHPGLDTIVTSTISALWSGLYWATHMKLTRVPGPAAAWNLHDLMPTSPRERSGKNNEVINCGNCEILFMTFF